MSYLKFEKALMTNLQESLPKEILRTNRSQIPRSVCDSRAGTRRRKPCVALFARL